MLYEDNHLLVVNKPAPLATMGKRPGEETLVSRAKQYVKHKYHRPGNVYIGVVSRLDAVVTGVVVLARTSKAAARLHRQFLDRGVKKFYWAIVTGQLRPAEGRCHDWIRKNDEARRMVACREFARGAKEASLTYRTLSRNANWTLVDINLETGRKHQIRLQLSRRGHPILGDSKYGSQASFPTGIALHAHRVELNHPVKREPIVFDAPTPRYWSRFMKTVRSR